MKAKVAARPRVARRVASAIRIVLLMAGIAQLVVALVIIQTKTAEIREQLVADGLRSLRLAAEAGKLNEASLEANFGDLPGHAIVTYREGGELLARSSSDVEVPTRLDRSQLIAIAARPGRPIFFEFHALTPWAVHGGIVSTQGPGGIIAVGVFDRWSSARLAEGLGAGLLGGWVASIVVAGIATLFLTRRIMRGLEQAEKVVRRVASGELGTRLPSYGDDEIGRLADDFNRMADSLEQHVESLRKEKEARLRRFADWTHEVVTPLTSVLGYLESLQMEGFDEATRKRYVATAHEQALALKALSDDLATLSRLDFEGLELARSPVDLGAVARGEVEALSAAAIAKTIALTIASPDCPVRVEGDRPRLAQVVRNLLTNALQHTPEGGRIVVDVRVEQDRALLEVSDTGEGIAPEQLAQLGEPFYRVDTSRDRRTGGRGLGLAVTRGIVEAHRGTLRIRSELGRGTIASVDFPMLP